MLRAGIIGCGGITERRHGPMLASLSNHVTVVALADLSQERLDLMGGKLGVASENLYTDWGAGAYPREIGLGPYLHPSPSA